MEPAVEEPAQRQQTGQRERARQNGGRNGGELERGQSEEPHDRPGEQSAPKAVPPAQPAPPRRRAGQSTLNGIQFAHLQVNMPQPCLLGEKKEGVGCERDRNRHG